MEKLWVLVMKRQAIALGIAVSALAVGIGSVGAFAAVPIPGADGKIRACVKYEDINRYEQMRWITTATCPKGEKLITWNAKGIKGDKGDTGATGPAGPIGAAGPPGTSGTIDSHFGFEAGAFIPGFHQMTVLTITPGVGRFIVTATTEVINHFDDPKGAACAINSFAGNTKRNISVQPHDTDELTVIGEVVTAGDGKINLICSGQPESDDVKGPEFSAPKMIVTRII